MTGVAGVITMGNDAKRLLCYLYDNHGWASVSYIDQQGYSDAMRELETAGFGQVLTIDTGDVFSLDPAAVNSREASTPVDFEQLEQRTLAALDRAYERSILRELEREARPEVGE